MIGIFIKKRRDQAEKQRAMQQVTRMFSGELDDSEADAIKQWRQDHADTQQDFLDTFHALADLGALAGRPECQAIAGQNSADSYNPRVKKWSALAVAATVLLAVLIGTKGYIEGIFDPPGSNLVRYVTRVGEQKTVDLSDGSTLTLNTGSEVLVDISEHYRRVSLERGEAFFDVAKDAGRPFSVNIDSRSVTVLGTAFNIYKTPEQFTLSVLEGVVAVHKKEEQVLGSSPELLPLKTAESVIDSPGQRLVKAGTVAKYYTYRNRVSVSRPDRIDRMVTWRKGLLRYGGQPLSKVVQDFNRYSGKKILIETAAIMDLEIYATFRVDQINMALADLERTHPIKVIQHFDRIVITGVMNGE